VVLLGKRQKTVGESSVDSSSLQWAIVESRYKSGVAHSSSSLKGCYEWYR